MFQSNISQRFLQEKSGAVAIMTALMMSFLVPVVMAAIDISRIHAEKSDAQRTLDSALTAVTRMPNINEAATNGELQKRGNDFLRTRFALEGRDKANPNARFTFDENKNTVTATVEYTPDSIFIGSLFGIEKVALEAEAIPREAVEVEIAMVLDVSGSMEWSMTTDDVAPVGSRRIDALQDGVDRLVDTLDEGAGSLAARVSVIPYSSSVDARQLFANAGIKKGNWFTGANGKSLRDLGLLGNLIQAIAEFLGFEIRTNTGKSKLKGVWVAERVERTATGGFKISTAAPSRNAKIPVMSQTEITEACHDSYIASFGSRCIDVVEVDGRYWQDENYYAPRIGVMSLSAPAEAKDFVANFEPEGGTAGHLGAAWGLYSLIPGWDGVFKHKDGPPKAFDEAEKIMVVMTDGDFTMTHDSSMTTEETYDYFQAVCKQARGLGVTVFTIGLQTSVKADAELRECAGATGKYFAADNRLALIDAFEEIAESAGELRISR